MFTIMTALILVGMAFVLGSAQPVVAHGVLVERFEDRWLKLCSVFSGILFGGILIAEQFSRFLSWGGDDSLWGVVIAACIIAFLAIVFGVLVLQISLKSASIMRDRLRR